MTFEAFTAALDKSFDEMADEYRRLHREMALEMWRAMRAQPSGDVLAVVDGGLYRRLAIKARARRYVRSSRRLDPWRKRVRRL